MSDRALGMDRDITRRDFLNGVAIGVAGSLLTPPAVLRGLTAGADPAQAAGVYYPPALTGMRGSHDGAFEVAHALRDGRSFGDAANTGERYDLVVVGAGLSGLAAALFFQTSAGPGARTLLLDNHDDFGGHAKRNEFTDNGGRTLLLNGGTSNVESVSQYSTVARTLLRHVGVDPAEAQATSDGSRRFYDSLGLRYATFFARETFGADRFVPGRLRAGEEAGEWLARTPLDPKAQQDLARLYSTGVRPDYLPGLSDWDKKMHLARISYKQFLEEAAGVHPQVIAFLDDRPKGLFCVGIDAFAALYAWASGYPGFQPLGLEPFSAVGPLLHIGGGQHGREHEWGGEGDTWEWPDGNATLARLIVRQLIPDAVPGRTMQDVVTARLDYSRLDRAGQAARIRLNSTAVRVSHVGDPDAAREVEVAYVQQGKAHKVRAEHVVLACWHPVIPYICPELSPAQKQALGYGEKMPIVYTNVMLRNWKPFVELGVRSVSCPGMYHTGFSLGRAIEIGDYRPPRSPDEPMVLHMTRTPCAPGKPKKEQHRLGRHDLLSASFETFERHIRNQLARGLSPSSFDPARDIVAITVNRWPHGYAYSYDTLADPVEWALFAPEDRPCVLASRRFGRISIANADAAATPHTDAAIDEAHRAVGEQLVVRSRARSRAPGTASRPDL